jgi:cell fate (sporulation/competence/biofilm development) regulator YlbF (YheA/YmcA/DUF963 family)
MKAYDVVDEILKDPVIKEIKRLNQSIDHVCKEEIKAFNDAKIKYQMILNQGGTYHPDYKQSIKELSETKKALYEMPEVKKYLELELEFEAKLNEFLNTISKTISDHVPAPNKFGMIKKGGSCHVY